jgi:hypothetical protein
LETRLALPLVALMDARMDLPKVASTELIVAVLMDYYSELLMELN